MLAVDTNVLVRFLTGDDPVQSPAARAAIATDRVFLSTTVMLETGWVLRKTYGFAPGRIADRLRAVAGLKTVCLENDALVATALDWFEQGLDFVDALHLAGAEHCEAFLTFDRRLAKLGSALGSLDVRAP